jgi:maleylpyruvate isomerase
MTPTVSASVAWIGDGTELFIDHLHAADLAAPSLLPGWTNGHVAAHVARNADALGRLLQWARTGVETPMYASREARNSDIERDPHRSPQAQLDDVHATAEALARAIGTLGERAWTTQVRGASGRPFPASQVPWMRVKEVWLHAVDVGASADDLPADLVDEMLSDVGSSFAAKDDAPGLRLTVTDSGRELVIGDGGVQVTGPATQLLAWLVGRSAGTDLACADRLPSLPDWL